MADKASVKNKPKTAEEKAASAKKLAQSRRAAELKRRQQQQTLIAGIVAVAVLILVVIVVVIQNQPVTAEIPEEAAGAYTNIAAKPNYMGRTEDGYFYIGAPDAPVVLEEFSSFSCSACRSYHEGAFKQLQDKIEAGHLKFVYIPLTTYGSFESSGMARGAICAGMQGKFWEMHDVLFDWQGRYGQNSNNQARLAAGAELLGLNKDEFNACFNSSETTALIDRAASLAKERVVAATPTVYMDGAKIYPDLPDGSDGPNLNQLRGMIEAKVGAK